MHVSYADVAGTSDSPGVIFQVPNIDSALRVWSEADRPQKCLNVAAIAIPPAPSILGPLSFVVVQRAVELPTRAANGDDRPAPPPARRAADRPWVCGGERLQGQEFGGLGRAQSAASDRPATAARPREPAVMMAVDITPGAAAHESVWSSARQTSPTG